MKYIIFTIIFIVWTFFLTLAFKNHPKIPILSWSSNLNNTDVLSDCLFYWKKIDQITAEGTKLYCIKR